MLLCSLMFLTCSNGIQTSMMDTQWEAHIMLWHLRTLTLLMQNKILYEISRFHWKFPSLFGDYWKTDFQRNSIFKGAVFFRSQILYAFRGAATTSLHLICSFIALFLAHCGSILGPGLAYVEQILNISDHFHQFIHYTGHSKARRSFLQLLWLLCVWLVWNERNNRLFNNIETPIDQLLEKVKYHSLWWLRANKTTFVYGTQNWLSNLLSCLGIDWLCFCNYTLWLVLFLVGPSGTSCTEGSPTPLLFVNIFHFDFFKKECWETLTIINLTFTILLDKIKVDLSLC